MLPDAYRKDQKRGGRTPQPTKNPPGITIMPHLRTQNMDGLPRETNDEEGKNRRARRVTRGYKLTM